MPAGALSFLFVGSRELTGIPEPLPLPYPLSGGCYLINLQTGMDNEIRHA